MKRIVLALGIVSVVVVLIVGASYVVIKAALDRAALPKNNPDTPAPFTYKQLEEMMEAADPPADAKIPLLIECFDKSQMTDEGMMPLGIGASEVVARIGAPAVKPVRERLSDKNPKVRYYAVQTLARMGPIAKDAADDLLMRLKDKDAEVRRKSVYALGQLGVKNDAVIAALVSSIDDPDPDVSSTALDVLADQIGTAALPKLYKIVATAKDPTRGRLMDTLEKIGSPPADALPLLAELARDPNDIVRQNAIKLLGKLAKPEKAQEHPAVPIFQELLRDKKMLKKAADVDLVFILPGIIALGADARPILPELQAVMLANEIWDADAEMTEIFKNCGPDGAQALTNVLKKLYDPKQKLGADGGARQEVAVRRLGQLGANAKVATPVLIEILKTPGPLHARVLETLGDIGPGARDAVPTVEKIAASNPQLAEQARVALRRMGVVQKKKD